jgi:hypothetical protein
VNEEKKTRLRIAITAILTLAEELALPARKYPNLENPAVIGAYVEVVAGNGIGAKAVTMARSVILGGTFFPTPAAIVDAAKPFQIQVEEDEQREFMRSLVERIDENGVPVLVPRNAKPALPPASRELPSPSDQERRFEELVGKVRRI